MKLPASLHVIKRHEF